MQNIDRIVDLVYDLLNEYDINLWKDISYIDLAEEWVELVEMHEGDDAAIKRDLKAYLEGE